MTFVMALKPACTPRALPLTTSECKCVYRCFFNATQAVGGEFMYTLRQSVFKGFCGVPLHLTYKMT